MKKILILEANPHKDLNLNDEIRDLLDVIKLSRYREEFEIDFGLQQCMIPGACISAHVARLLRSMIYRSDGYILTTHR